MRSVVAILVLAAIALLGSRRILFGRHVPLGARLVFVTGTEYLLVGLLLGDGYLGILDRGSLEALQPLVHVALGWVGLLFGLQFEVRKLRTLPVGFFRVSMIQAAVAMVFVGSASLPFLPREGGGFAPGVLLAALTVAAAAGCTGQSGLALVRKEARPGSRRLSMLLRTVASMDPVAGLLVFGLAAGLLPAAGGGNPVQGIRTAVLCTAVSILMGWILYSLCKAGPTPSEILLFILGTAAICGGLSAKMGCSTLFMAAVCGFVTANVCTLRARLVRLLTEGETFLYVVLLVLVGARWSMPTAGLLALGVGFFAVRLLGKLVGGFIATRPFTGHIPVPAAFGLGLTAQAGMALAIVVDYQQMAHGGLGDTVLTVGVLGIVLSELAGPSLSLWVMRRSRAREVGE